MAIDDRQFRLIAPEDLSGFEAHTIRFVIRRAAERGLQSVPANRIAAQGAHAGFSACLDADVAQLKALIRWGIDVKDRVREAALECDDSIRLLAIADAIHWVAAVVSAAFTSAGMRDRILAIPYYEAAVEAKAITGWPLMTP